MKEQSCCIRPGCEGTKLVWQSVPREAQQLICPKCKASYGRRNENVTITSGNRK